MSEWISNEWLDKVADRKPEDGLPPMTDQTIRDMAQELLEARQTIEKLIANSERLAELIEENLNYVYPNRLERAALEKHNDLLTELKVEE